MRFEVKLITRKMGMQCQTCRQEFHYTSINAQSAEEAVAKAKGMTGADPETHAFGVSLVREIK